MTLYHAGDLNWWHWDEEGKGPNGTMAANYKKFTAPLRDLSIDVAFHPLDPRLGEHAADGLLYLMDLADIHHLFPMHQWNNSAITREFCQQHPHFASCIHTVDFPGQSWKVNT